MIALRQILAQAKERLRRADIPEPELSAELLLAHALGCERAFLFREPEFAIPAELLQRFEQLLLRRLSRCPVAYLLGEQEFFGLRFAVTPAVLVPRPETELLVERALEKLQEVSGAPLLADLGTGSGCVAIAIAKRDPRVRFLAMDRSKPALAIARANAKRHGVLGRIRFVQGDWLTPIAQEPRFDLILSNPPYIDPQEKTELMPEVREHEPEQALFSPPGHPTFFHGEIARQAASCLKPGAWLMMELGAEQAQTAVGEVRQRGYDPILCRRDFSGIERVLEAQLLS